MAAEQAVRARAHAFWESEGRPEGRALDHWLRAERELGGDVPVDHAAAAADHSVMGEEDPQVALPMMATPPADEG